MGNGLKETTTEWLGQNCTGFCDYLSTDLCVAKHGMKDLQDTEEAEHLDRVPYQVIHRWDEIIEAELGVTQVHDGNHVDVSAHHEEIVAEEVDLPLAFAYVTQLGHLQFSKTILHPS